MRIKMCPYCGTTHPTGKKCHGCGYTKRAARCELTALSGRK